MNIKSTLPSTVDDYIASFPPEIRAILEKIRLTIRQAAPTAQESIKYQIPTFTLNGNLISFAAYKKHIGLYPAPSGTPAFNKKLAAYRVAKASVRFPLERPIPFDLIRSIVKLRVKDNLERVRSKGKKK